MQNSSKNILFIGYGKMGEAIADSLTKISGFNFYIIDPQLTAQKTENIHFLTNSDSLNEKICFDIVFLAIKPQIITETADIYKKFIKENTIIISILAGKSLDFLENIFGQEKKIIRLMPNLAACYGNSTTTACHNSNISTTEKQDITIICQSFGTITWLEDEELMHISTAINGSGPAMFAFIIKSIEEEAAKHSLSKATAKKLALATMENMVELLKDGQSADELMQKVASKGGTTEAMLHSLKENKADEIIKLGLNAAISKSKNF